MATVALIDYGSGNLRSAEKALARAAREAGTAQNIVVTGDPVAVAAAARSVPFLGICVGMQLLARMGHEFGDHPGLGWIDGEVVKLQPEGALKIPHMGWNELTIVRPHPLLEDLGDNPHAYFVHSYEFRAAHRESLFATTDNGGEVVAMIARGNIAGTQFHPEKSQAVGLALLKNFLLWRP